MPPELKELELRLRTEYAFNKNWGTRLVENLIGGGSCGLMLFFGYLIVAEHFWFHNWQFYICIGMIVFCVVNAIRFLRDEVISIPYLFYKLGAASQSQIIAKLQEEKSELATQLTMQHSSIATRQTHHANTVLQSALNMIKLYYTGHAIDRESCAKKGIRETDWNQARALLVKAGIVNVSKTKNTELVSKDYAEAKLKLQEMVKNGEW